MAEVVRGGQQAETDVVVESDEASHAEKGQAVQAEQAWLAHMPAQGGEQVAHLEGVSPKVGRWGQAFQEQQAQQQADHADDPDGGMPGEVIAEKCRSDPPRHAPHGGASDVESHGGADGAGIHLLAQIGHGHRWDPGQRNPLDQSQGQQRPETVAEEGHDGQERGEKQGNRHERLAPERL